MFLGRILVFLVLMSGMAHGQSSGGFVPGQVLTAVELNAALQLKTDWPFLGPYVGPIGAPGVALSGTPATGYVPIATGSATAVWGVAGAIILPAATGVAATDTATIQNAINALPANGGTLSAPCGSNYSVNATINIGNGTSSAVSTKNGVVISGNCAVPSYSVTAYEGWPAGQFNGVRFTWSGSAGGTMFSVNGGLDGWGFNNVVFNCSNSAAVGLQNISGQNGTSSNLTFLGCTSVGYYSTTVPGIVSGGVFHTDALRNKFYGVTVSIPGGAIGISLDGENSTLVNVADTDFNQFDVVQLVTSNTGAGAIGIYIRNADSNMVNNVACTLNKSTDICIEFDYAGINVNLPTANIIQNVDWGSASATPVATVGSSSGRHNTITGVIGANGGVPSFTVDGVYMNDNSVQMGGGKSQQTGIATSDLGFTIDKPNGIFTQNLYFDGSWKYFQNGMGSVTEYFTSAGYYTNYVAAVNAGGPGAAATLIDAFDVHNNGTVVFNHGINASPAYDVRLFGAVCDGTTDDATAINAAVTVSSTNNGIPVYLPAFCAIASPINISMGYTTIVGNGPNSGLKPAVGINAININQIGSVYLDSFAIIYPSLATMGTVAISVTSPSGENVGSIFNRVEITNANYGIDFVKASKFTVSNSIIDAYRANAIAIANTNNADSGDSAIYNNQIGGAGGAVGGAAIYWQSSGGIRINNNKINVAPVGIQIALASGATTTGVYIIGNSIEGIDPAIGITGSGAAIQLGRQGATGQLLSVIIADNEMVGTYGVYAPTDANGVWLTGLTVTGGSFSGNPSATVYAVNANSFTGINISGMNVQPSIGGTTTMVVTGSAGTQGSIGPNSCGGTCVGDSVSSGTITQTSLLQSRGSTIGGLPTCNAGLIGARTHVTNAQTTPTFLGAVSTTGAVVAPVFCNGSAWVYG